MDYALISAVSNLHGKTISYQFSLSFFTPRNFHDDPITLRSWLSGTARSEFCLGFAGVSTIYLVVPLSLFIFHASSFFWRERRQGENVCAGWYHGDLGGGKGYRDGSVGLALDWDASLGGDLIVQFKRINLWICFPLMVKLDVMQVLNFYPC